MVHDGIRHGRVKFDSVYFYFILQYHLTLHDFLKLKTAVMDGISYFISLMDLHFIDNNNIHLYIKMHFNIFPKKSLI